jgi:hypothetical protein
MSHTDVTCNGAANGTITVSSASGGYGTYEYTINGGTSWQSSASFSNLVPGPYDIRVRDAANTACTYTINGSLVLTEPAVLGITASSNTPVNAGLALNLSSTTTGGNTTFTYAWSGPNGYTSANEDPVISPVTTAANGTYTVTVTDDKGCSASATTTVLVYGSQLYVNDTSLVGDIYTTAVGNDGNNGTSADPFATIAKAMSIAKPGDTIWVDAGTYAAAVTVTKHIDIIGAGNTTIVQAGAGNNAFILSSASAGASLSDRTVIKKMRVNTSSKGVYMDQHVDHVLIDSMTFDVTAQGIHFNNLSGTSEGWTISNSAFNNHTLGINVATTASMDTMVISNNTFTNISSRGIYVGQSNTTVGTFDDVVISGNTFTTVGTASNTSAMYFEKLSNATIEDNIITNSGTSTNARGIIASLKFASYSNITIQRNKINETRGGSPTLGFGVQVSALTDATLPASLSGVVVSSNEISGYRNGISIEGITNWTTVSIQNNLVQGGGWSLNANSTGSGGGAMTAVSNNSFSGGSLGAINNLSAAGTITADCNWFGSAVITDITPKLSGAVTYTTRLVSGTDAQPSTTGFQPAGSCLGYTLTLAASVTNVSCNGGSTGAIDLTPTGNSPFTYAWTKVGDGSFSASTEDLSGLTAGTYNVTVTDPYGTSTTATAFVTQPALITGSESRTICSSQLPYTWNGVSFSAAGSQNATLTAANGCDSIVTMTLTVKLSSATIETISACGSYTWHGTTYTASNNTATWTGTNVVGCDSVVTLNLTINPIPNAGTISGNSIVCVGGSENYVTNGDAGGTWVSADTLIAQVDPVTGLVSGIGTGFVNIMYIVNTPSCGSDTAFINVQSKLCVSVLSVKAFIQGYYSGPQTMRPALLNSGVGTSSSEADTIIVELYDDLTGSLRARDTAILQTNGVATAVFPNLNGPHYIAIRHRNAMETWSANPVTIADVVSYDFTTAANKAYGSNQVHMGGGVYAMWSGDVNQDGAIESTDYTMMENDVLSILFGYQVTDITGDGVVESSDYSMMENNVYQIIFVAKPF